METCEAVELDPEWMTLEDYCLERDLRLEHTQLNKEGKAITRYHRSAGTAKVAA